MELWASAPELYAVTIISPSGEQIPRILVRRGASEQFNFILREQQLRWITGSIQKRRQASSYFPFYPTDTGIVDDTHFPAADSDGKLSSLAAAAGADGWK